MSSSSLLHIVWGPIERSSSTTSPSQDGSSEACGSVRSQLPDQHQLQFQDLSSLSGSEQLDKELRAHGSMTPNHQGVEQYISSTPTTLADGPTGVRKQVRFPNVLPSPSASECPGMQVARMQNRRGSNIVASVRGLELLHDALLADNGAASFNGVAPPTQPSSKEVALLDSFSMWSQGSVKHQTRNCKPCHYAHTEAGCIKGRDCDFCHLPHTGSGEKRPSKNQRKQCQRLAMLLAEQQPEEGLARRTLKQVASKSPYLRSFIRKLCSTGTPSEPPARSSTEAASSRQTCSSQHDQGEKTPVG